jgi:hypothetical protein
VGFPGKEDFTVFEENSIVNRGESMQGVFFNKTGNQFEDVTKSSGLSYLSNEDAIQVFAHSSMALDLDGDGNQDIVVIDDRGNLGPVYKNLGGGKFAEVANKIGLGFNGLGMSTATASVESNGRPDIAMTYVNFAAATRLQKSCGGEAGAVGALAGGGVRLYRNQGNGKFVESTNHAGLEWAGEGVAGLEFLDYNNDGHPDLFVSNGLWSGTKREQDIGSLFTLSLMNGGNKNRINGHGGRSVYMDFLANFRGDFWDGKFQPGGERPSMAGYQRKRLFRNNGDGTFTEVGFLEGVDSIADGYILARMDINDDGKMDLVLRNADPGTSDYTFPVVELFRNRTKNRNSLSVVLEGSPARGSNRDAIGAEVTVELNGRKQFQALVGNNGPAQSERVLHFGLGKARRVSRVTVKFPSGNKKVFRNVPAGRLVVKEEEDLQLGQNMN